MNNFIVFLSVPQYLLLNAVCCSLVNKSTAPGQKDWDSEKSVWTRITNLAKDISVSDAQFLLKVGMHVCVSWCVQGYVLYLEASLFVSQTGLQLLNFNFDFKVVMS